MVSQTQNEQRKVMVLH